MEESVDRNVLLGVVSDIVSAYVSHNPVPSDGLAALICDVCSALLSAASGTTVQAARETQRPAVPIRRSVTPDYITCLDDGKKLKSLKRHLRHLGTTPEEYKAKWGLPSDYPMVAPNYAQTRSELAKRMGLGQQKRQTR